MVNSEACRKPKYPTMKGTSCPEHAMIQKVKIQRMPNDQHQIIGNGKSVGRRRTMTVLVAMYNPLETKAVQKRIREPLFNVESSNPDKYTLIEEC